VALEVTVTLGVVPSMYNGPRMQETVVQGALMEEAPDDIPP
jgi:hypothetical protein